MPFARHQRNSFYTKKARKIKSRAGSIAGAYVPPAAPWPPGNEASLRRIHRAGDAPSSQMAGRTPFGKIPGAPRGGWRSALTLRGHFVIQLVWLIAPRVRQGEFVPARAVPIQKSR